MSARLWMAMCGTTLAVGLLVGAFFGADVRRELHARGTDEANDKHWQELARDNRAAAAVQSRAGPHFRRRDPQRGPHSGPAEGLPRRPCGRDWLGRDHDQQQAGRLLRSSPTGTLSTSPRWTTSRSSSTTVGNCIPERVLADAATDVAVMKISGTSLTPCRWADSNQAEIGNLVLAMGSPFGLSRSVTLGIISAKGRRQLKLGSAEVLNQDFLQTDAAINPATAAARSLDLQGRVIGINTAIASSSGGNEGIGFSIPSNPRPAGDGATPRTRRRASGVPRRPARSAVRAENRQDAQARPGPRLARSRRSIQHARRPRQPPGGRRGAGVRRPLTCRTKTHLINLVSLTPIGRQVR